MLYKISLLVVALVVPFITFSQSQQVIVSIGDHEILAEEFERFYQKNNQYLTDEAEKKSPKEYMDLFIDYKLKVIEAENLQYDTISSFQKEMEQYRSELAEPYLTHVEYTDETVKTAYYRITHEVDASHILLLLDSNAMPEDTARIYSKLMDIRKQILEGADFNEMAAQYSEDPSAKTNSGELGYFKGFEMVYPFEDAAYNTPIGEVSLPVRTSYGYHLIKVHDKREITGQVKLAHILLRTSTGSSEETINSKKQLADSLLVLLKNGEDFSNMAQKFSDNRQTAANGGVATYYYYSDLPEPLAESAFSLQNDGDISDVIRTASGWQIIMRLDFQPVASFEKQEELLINKIKQNPEISSHNEEIFLNKLKADYNYSETGLSEFINQVLQNESNIPVAEQMENPDKTLFSYNNKNSTFGDFSSYIDQSTPKQGTFVKSKISDFYNQFLKEVLLAEEENQLEEKYPEFKYLYQEYYEGILLFNFSEDAIWNAALEDSVGLAEFYKNNPRLFMWNNRFEGWIFQCNTQDEKDLIETILAEDDKISKEELLDIINNQQTHSIQIEKGIFANGDNPIVDHLVWDKAKPDNFKNGLSFIHGNLIKSEPKTLKEAKGLYISAYQDYLEEELLKTLHKKYKIKVNKKLLKTIEAE